MACHYFSCTFKLRLVASQRDQMNQTKLSGCHVSIRLSGLPRLCRALIGYSLEFLRQHDRKPCTLIGQADVHHMSCVSEPHSKQALMELVSLSLKWLRRHTIPTVLLSLKINKHCPLSLHYTLNLVRFSNDLIMIKVLGY